MDIGIRFLASNWPQNDTSGTPGLLKEAERECQQHDATTSKLATMATQEGNSPIGGTIGKTPSERDMDMAEA